MQVFPSQTLAPLEKLSPQLLEQVQPVQIDRDLLLLQVGPSNPLSPCWFTYQKVKRCEFTTASENKKYND